MEDLLDIERILGDTGFDDKVQDILHKRKRRLVKLYNSADGLFSSVSGVSDLDQYDYLVSSIIPRTRHEGFQWGPPSKRGEHPRTLYLEFMSGLRNHIVKEVCKDLISHVKQIDRVIFNERDLQLYLSDKLRASGHYDNVFLEYHLPKGINSDFDRDYAAWKTECLSIDIVLEIEGRFIAIELKYKLKSFFTNISRFGESSNVQVLKNQSAQNIGRYQFWKDVKRLELLKQSYKNVLGGVSLFITNDTNYKRTSKGADYEKFSMEEGANIGGISKPLDWRSPYKKNKNGELQMDKLGNLIRKFPLIELKNIYVPSWEEVYMINSESFHCCHVIV